MIERNEELVTVFGGGGFIGRYVCEMLFRRGVRVRIAQRDPKQAYAIQPLAQVGRFGFARADVSNPHEVRAALKSATAAINLTGVFGKKMQAVHVDGARNIAEAAAAEGLRALVHISAIGADAKSPSNYGRTKAAGEEAVRAAFPAATIVRPSLAFGPEDNLTNRFAALARLPVLPVLAAKRNFQPVYVRDLAQAIAMAALDPRKYGGETFEIGGPQVMSMIELQRAIIQLSGQSPYVAPLPDLFGNLLSRLGWLPGAPLTRDQWLMLQRDNVAAKGAPGLEAFGIEPTPLAAVGAEWLGRFESAGRVPRRRIHLTENS
ncbi:MAG TPA: complex I NDUFA9 subunit family protein [Stellaceae bacterium]|nr:complex I NDUFA9 subunit family protein [Stellaceae bacterium]